MRATRWGGGSAALALTAAVWGVWQRGASLGTPRVSSWQACSAWYDQVGPAVAVMATARLAIVAIVGWLVVATTLEVLATRSGRHAIRRVADLVAPRSLQRLVHGLAGFSLTAGLAVVAPSAGIPHAPPPSSGTATMHVIAEAPPAVPVSVPAAATAVVVRQGDSLWSIAREAVAQRNDLAPGDGEVAEYWLRLIDVNRAALVDPDNPDLIYRGQTFMLPSL